MKHPRPAPSKRPPPARAFPPSARADARVLILGSMPGEASLRARRYYAHPRNQFWEVMGACVGAGRDMPYRVRLAALRDRGIALWDVARQCRRRGSLDARIEPASVEPADIAGLLRRCPRIFVVLFNGRAAAALFRRHVRPGLADRAVRMRFETLPSTSPAHAARGFDAKLAVWRAALEGAGIDCGTPATGRPSPPVLPDGLSRRTR